MHQSRLLISAFAFAVYLCIRTDGCNSAKTYITCINCKGDGRTVPIFLNKQTSRDPESELEEIGMG
jgi:hypothetical protein